MEKMISTRVPNALHEQLNRADITQSENIRRALEDELMRESTGVCAITGNRCYINNFATVGATTPLGNYLNIPHKAETIDLINDEFETVTKCFNSGATPPETAYIDDIGVATYKAETDYIADTHPNGEVTDAWSRAAFKDTNTDTDTNAVRRLIAVLEYIAYTEPESTLITAENVWNEHNTTVQERVIEYADNTDRQTLHTVLDRFSLTHEK